MVKPRSASHVSRTDGCFLTPVAVARNQCPVCGRGSGWSIRRLARLRQWVEGRRSVGSEWSAWLSRRCRRWTGGRGRCQGVLYHDVTEGGVATPFDLIKGRARKIENSS